MAIGGLPGFSIPGLVASGLNLIGGWLGQQGQQQASAANPLSRLADWFNVKTGKGANEQVLTPRTGLGAAWEGKPLGEFLPAWVTQHSEDTVKMAEAATAERDLRLGEFERQKENELDRAKAMREFGPELFGRLRGEQTAATQQARVPLQQAQQVASETRGAIPRYFAGAKKDILGTMQQVATASTEAFTGITDVLAGQLNSLRSGSRAILAQTKQDLVEAFDSSKGWSSEDRALSGTVANMMMGTQLADTYKEVAAVTGQRATESFISVLSNLTSAATTTSSTLEALTKGTMDATVAAGDLYRLASASLADLDKWHADNMSQIAFKEAEFRLGMDELELTGNVYLADLWKTVPTIQSTVALAGPVGDAFLSLMFDLVGQENNVMLNRFAQEWAGWQTLVGGMSAAAGNISNIAPWGGGSSGGGGDGGVTGNVGWSAGSGITAGLGF